jgi:hypothetical protein
MKLEEAQELGCNRDLGIMTEYYTSFWQRFSQ